MKTYRAAVLMAAFLCLASLADAWAAGEDDDFSGQSLNTCRWFDWGQQARPAQVENGLRLSTRSDLSYSSAKVLSQYSVAGDFSVAVDVTAAAGFEASIPNASQMDGILGLYVDNQNAINLSLAKVGDRNAVRAFVKRDGQHGILGPVVLPEGTTTVRLRLAQAGGRISADFMVGQRWSPVGSTLAFSGGEYLVLLSATNVGLNRQFDAVFNSFTIAGGTSSLRPYKPAAAADRPDLMLGSFVADYLIHRTWGEKWRRNDPLQAMADNGMGWLRLGVTTVSVPALTQTPAASWSNLPFDTPFWSSRELAGQIMKEAAAKGMKINLTLYLSDKAAHASTQDAPAEWRGLSVEETARRVQAYARETAAYYKSQGLHIDLWDIGNEIEAGILNFRLGERLPRPPAGVSPLEEPSFMRSQVWQAEAVLLKAAIAGIREVEPTAKVTLHVAAMAVVAGDMMVKNFFKAMIELGVEYDYAGLSLPYAQLPWRLNDYSFDCWLQRVQETADHIARLGKRTIISEASYPHAPGGQVAAPIPGLPFTVEGQRAFVAELLRFAYSNPNIAGLFYFYPEMYPGVSTQESTINVQNSGLFDANEQPLPSLRAFRLAAIQSGWWYKSDESGRGYAIEYSPRTGNMYVGAFLYAPADRSAIWYSSMCGQGGAGCSGQLMEYAGAATLLGDAAAPVVVGSRGDISLTVSGASAVLNWPGGSIPLSRFNFSTTVAVPPGVEGMPQNGWWYTAGRPGHGWFIETQRRADGRSMLFAAGFMYGRQGQATWYVTNGGMTDDAVYEGSLQEFAGGTPMTSTGSYQPPTQQEDRGPVSIQFQSDVAAKLTLPNGAVVDLARFPF